MNNDKKKAKVQCPKCNNEFEVENGGGAKSGLYWEGKRTNVERIPLPFQVIETINESRATREELKKMPLARGMGMDKAEEAGWKNKLIWGDNKYVMSSLLDEFAGKIDLIYIDPPFATGADFTVNITIGDVEWTKEASVIEEKAYRDTWGKGLDSYLQMMYDRLVIMRDLLSEKGSIYVHCDSRVYNHLRLIFDEIYGLDNFRNEIIWRYRRWPAPSSDFQKMHDNIMRYSRGNNWIWNQLYEERAPSTLRAFGNKRIISTRKETGEKVLRATEEESQGVQMSDVWDISYIQGSASFERASGGYFPTQKPKALLERVIKASSNEDSIVADFFCGSGTTLAVAEQHKRQWIGCDLSRFAIHTARKRLLEIDGCRPFEVLNLGKYERQYWQGITFGDKKGKDTRRTISEYLRFIVKLYQAEPITGFRYLHGKKGRKMVSVGSVDAPVTLREIQEALEECKSAGQKELDVLGWEWEMGLHDVVEEESKTRGINLYLKTIPREVMDTRAVDSGDIQFFELAYLDAKVSKNKYDEFVVELKDFVIQNTDLIPEEVRKKIKKWSDYIDYWAVDWEYKYDTFHNQWQSYRTRKARTLQLKSDGHKYEKKGNYAIMIKVIDIFGNDTTRIVEVTL